MVRARAAGAGRTLLRMRALSEWTADSIGSRRYVDPAKRYVAAFASPWRRAAAGAIDWGVCYVASLIVAIPLGAVQALGAVSHEEGDLGGVPGGVLFVVSQLLAVSPALVYFALLLPTSQTLGMRAADIRSVSTATGRGIARRRAIVRGLAATLVALAFYAVFMRSTAFETSARLDRTSTYALDVAYVLVALGAVSALVMSLTPTRRSVVDRVFGTAVVDDLQPVEPVMGPWGPLNVFDTANQPGRQVMRRRDSAA